MTYMVSNYPIPKNEMERLLSLSEFDLDYSGLQDSLKDLTELAARIAGTPISFINLIDSYNQWAISWYGMQPSNGFREDSICQYTLMENEYFEVANLDNDDRFKEKDFVTGSPLLKYYFGVPLVSDDGFNIGSLCVLDKKANLLDTEKAALLKIVAKEIVNRLKTHKAIGKLKRRLAELLETQNTLADNIKAPIVGMIGLAQLYKNQDSNKEEISEVLNLIENGGQSLLALAEGILNNANNTSHLNLINKMHPNNLSAFKDSIEKLYQPIAQNKGIFFNVNGAQSCPLKKLFIDKNKLLQICGNLISNAMKFTPAGGTVNLEIGIKTIVQDIFLFISVEDSGSGFASENTNIDVDFADISIEEATQSGFGLSLVKRLVDSLAGTLQVSSKLAEGTKFEIHLPQQKN